MRKHDLFIPFVANARKVTDENYHYDRGVVFIGFDSGVDINRNVYEHPRPMASCFTIKILVITSVLISG